jgi:hypothetical protein
MIERSEFQQDGRAGMAIIDDFVKRQKEGATFVITAQMLRMDPQQFAPLAQHWLDEGGPGFNVVGVPYRIVVDGEFLISRVTVIKTRAASPEA